MITANNHNNKQVFDDSPLHMEAHERAHFEQLYQQGNELICWGEESNYLDSEFCSFLENADQGI